MTSRPIEPLNSAFNRRRFSGGLSTWLGLSVAAVWALLPVVPLAAKPDVTVVSNGPGATPFINLVQLKMDDVYLLDHVQFTIAPKPGSVTQAISARYSNAYLTSQGFVNTSTGAFTVPVFGLYQNYTNTVEIVCTFVDGTDQSNTLQLTSLKYSGGKYNGGEYDRPTEVVKKRTKDTTLSYDYMLMKTALNPHTPTIVDTDGNIRWVGTAGASTTDVIFFDNSFFIVDAIASGAAGGGTEIVRNEFNGSVSKVMDFAAAGVTAFHHNLDFGKSGILAAYSTAEYVESNVMEIDTAGNILHTWDLAKIITDAMVAGGDDPTQFVAAAGSLKDWFHNNANTYRPSDDSLIVSSRENFVIALDYETGAIKWIIGDPTKQWYQFPSLRKFALKAGADTHYPEGQHAVSFYQDNLLLFDDGYGSAAHTPPGKSRTYSAPRKYSLDLQARTFTEIWHYLNDPAIYSPVTSSVYEDQPGSYLIDYAVAGPYLFAELIGLNPAGDKVFDYKYTEYFTAATDWNTPPIHLENLVFD